jgi:hypothetical protein
MFALMIFACPASAYLDPASGSMLFAWLFGIIATGFFVLKSAWYKILSLAGRSARRDTYTHGIVCYSEGSQYWSTFQPLIISLNQLNEPVTYLTSDSEDVAFGFASDLLTVHYIGQGYRAYARLNFLNANICVSTTPGLDVLQIKRSKGVGKYVHVVHSSMDVHTYKLFSFDYYDVILCSGQHQIDSIRMLEARRHTHGKNLLLTGCLYYDELMRKKDRLAPGIGVSAVRRILIAPTWGRNGLLERFGAQLIESLIGENIEITIRPHPQSRVVEQDLLTSLEVQFEGRCDVTWDDDSDNFASLSQADILISDISGIIFDYVFLFEKPVITIGFDPDWLGTEGFDMDTAAFELTVLNEIGRQIAPEDIPSLPRIVEEVLLGHEIGSAIEAIRESMTVNFGQAGQVAARQILSLTQAQVSSVG